MLTANIYKVSEVNNHISDLFMQEGFFKSICVRGEIGTLRPWNKGIYFLHLKDEQTYLDCMLLPGCFNADTPKLENGMMVTLQGDIVPNLKNSGYRLKVFRILKEEKKLGQDTEELLKLKQELHEAGMFDPQYKKPIPRMIKTLGFVTSETGAVITDVTEIAKRRNPFIQIVMVPSMVSGDGAVDGIIRGIEQLEEYGCEVIIVGRGGGSQEDLWVYNNRAIAEAVFECSVPIISAVGHSIDYTILDLVADLRTVTPSEAAELAVGDLNEIITRLNTYRLRLGSGIRSKVGINRTRLQAIENKLKGVHPGARIEKKKLLLSGLEERLHQRMNRKLDSSRQQLGIYIEKLKGLSPLEKLNQGYAYVSKDGATLRSVKEVSPQEALRIYVRDGIVDARVTDTTALEWPDNTD